MADFSLTSMFVVPLGQTSLPSTGSTDALTPGKVGFYLPTYAVATAGNIGAAAYFYVAQGRANTYLQGSKRSDKINPDQVTEWYMVGGCATAATQVTDVSNWNVKCGESVTLTLRAHSSYLNTIAFNGWTRSVTVQAPCCDCGGDPCLNVDVPALIDAFIAKLNQGAPGTNPDNIKLSTFYQFQRIGTGDTAILRISGKPLTQYALPCDVAAFPLEYDRMWFRVFVTEGPATTADFIVDDSCDVVATAAVVQRASYPSGTASDIAQLEKNYYSYQAGYMKHLYRMAGFNGNFESYVSAAVVYNTFYIKFNGHDRSEYMWGDYVPQDSMVIIAAPNAATDGGSGISAAIEAVLEAALGAVAVDNACITTTSTTTQAPPTTTTTTTLNP